MNLETYFTAGVQEVRAWTYEKGWKAPQCAGVIHTDFEKGFIRAEVIKYEDFLQYGSEAAVKEAGKLYRMEISCISVSMYNSSGIIYFHS